MELRWFGNSERTEDNYWDVVEQLTNIIARVNLMNGLNAKNCDRLQKPNQLKQAGSIFIHIISRPMKEHCPFHLIVLDNRVKIQIF
jgi:hypothetical protein